MGDRINVRIICVTRSGNVEAPKRDLTKCKIRSEIRFLNTDGECLAEIYRPISTVYGDAMSRQNVTK